MEKEPITNQGLEKVKKELEVDSLKYLYINDKSVRFNRPE